jgi:GntR family transcriptional regulator
MALLSFHLEPRSGVPYYVQLADQVRQGIHFGVLRPGDQLPTVREVVAEVAVNPNTVLRAYRELEYGGLVVMKPGSGTFVADGAAAAIDQALYGSLRRELEHWIDSGRGHGVDDETLAALFDHVLHGKQRQGVA